MDEFKIPVPEFPDDQPAEQLSPENISDFISEPSDLFKLSPEEAPAALEALLFMAGDPIPVDKLVAVTGLEKSVLVPLLEQLSQHLSNDPRRGLCLRQAEDKYQLATKPEQLAILERLYQPRHRPPMSQPAYETLAIIAYNQPVTRAQVEAVRGVNSDSIISRLIERDFVCEVGTLDAPGRPSLFATTEQFLLDFGLRSVSDLPPMEMMMYGTLRDLEQSLESASGHGDDKQVTIDQLVAAFLPDHDRGTSNEQA
ncbi:MAG: SMC-Scp complex subunit ScpB [Eubacteriales bacterium]|nr:SMC-Scp complex subunit ScpB [Eubacteriales bacterium]